MEKAGTKTRDIKFFSPKNNAMMTVHTPVAQEFAQYLEEQPWVASYDTCVPLQMEHYPHVSPVDIRAEYFQTQWASDFVLHLADGNTGVREICTLKQFQKRAFIEKLEFSRRYWLATGVTDWRVYVYGGEGKLVETHDQSLC